MSFPVRQNRLALALTSRAMQTLSFRSEDSPKSLFSPGLLALTQASLSPYYLCDIATLYFSFLRGPSFTFSPDLLGRPQDRIPPRRDASEGAVISFSFRCCFFLSSTIDCSFPFFFSFSGRREGPLFLKLESPYSLMMTTNPFSMYFRGPSSFSPLARSLDFFFLT